MSTLKPISKKAIPAAIERALRYRLLNEPLEAESICLDVLATDPGNREALVTLLLALTDQFETEYVTALTRAKEVLLELTDEYERAYYEGIVHERWAKAEGTKDVPNHIVAGWLRQAMRSYERAESLAKADNPDAALRFNTCARILARLEAADVVPADWLHDTDASFADEPPP
jgi:hypothetical protein